MQHRAEQKPWKQRAHQRDQQQLGNGQPAEVHDAIHAPGEQAPATAEGAMAMAMDAEDEHWKEILNAQPGDEFEDMKDDLLCDDDDEIFSFGNESEAGREEALAVEERAVEERAVTPEPGVEPDEVGQHHAG